MRRLVREDAGIAMPLAIMMIVLIGVMGAGLLVFVQGNLRATVEVNRGQKAFNFADAGTQAGKSHLLTSDADFRSYDGTIDLSANPPNPESAWSCGTWNNTNAVCSRAGYQISNLDTSSDVDATVWIQYLRPAQIEAETRDPNFAPEVVPSGQTNYPLGKDYFKVVSRGVEGDAVRKVEAIYNTFREGGRPQAYYTRGTITISGAAAEIKNISLFAGVDIRGKGAAAVTGEDLAYQDWCSPPFNTARRNTTAAGAAALVSVASKTAGRDFDAGTLPRFVASTSVPATCQPASNRTEITFPFTAALPNMDALRTAAQTQAGPSPNGTNYWEVSSSSSVVSSGSGIVWPANSLSSTVVYVRSSNVSNVINWSVGNNCSDPPVRGTLVIDNGEFNVQQNKTPLRGAVVVNGAGPGNPNQTNDDVYKSTGTPCMESYAITSGDMTIAGNVSAVTQERGNAAASYGIKLASWRELYR